MLESEVKTYRNFIPQAQEAWNKNIFSDGFNPGMASRLEQTSWLEVVFCANSMGDSSCNTKKEIDKNSKCLFGAYLYLDIANELQTKNEHMILERLEEVKKTYLSRLNELKKNSLSHVQAIYFKNIINKFKKSSWKTINKLDMFDGNITLNFSVYTTSSKAVSLKLEVNGDKFLKNFDVSIDHGFLNLSLDNIIIEDRINDKEFKDNTLLKQQLKVIILQDKNINNYLSCQKSLYIFNVAHPTNSHYISFVKQWLTETIEDLKSNINNSIATDILLTSNKTVDKKFSPLKKIDSLPKECQEKVDNIHKLLLDISPIIKDLNTPAAFRLREMSSRYLPDTLSVYLRFPLSLRTKNHTEILIKSLEKIEMIVKSDIETLPTELDLENCLIANDKFLSLMIETLPSQKSLGR